MTANGLIDTGGILALLDGDDRWHHPCVEAFKKLRLPLLTSEAALTELFHLIGDHNPGGRSRLEIRAFGCDDHRANHRQRFA